MLIRSAQPDTTREPGPANYASSYLQYNVRSHLLLPSLLPSFLPIYPNPNPPILTPRKKQEYIAYDIAQVKLRYLLRVQMTQSGFGY